MGTLGTADDADLAAAHTAAVLSGRVAPDTHRVHISRADLLAAGNHAPSESQVATTSRRMRWRLAGYMPLEEVWIFRAGTRRTLHLVAPPPLTWCLEGLA